MLIPKGALVVSCQARADNPLHGPVYMAAMAQAAEAGAVILPPVPGFYTLPRTIADLVDHTITKILDQFDIEAGLIERWSGLT